MHSRSHHERRPLGRQEHGYISMNLRSTHIVRPISLVHTHQVPSVLFQHSVHTLRFSYHLEMEGRAKLWFHVNIPSEIHAKCICEFLIWIQHNHSQQPVVPPPIFENWLYGLQRGCGFHNWHYMCQLGKPLYHHQDDIISLWLRQNFDEVHAYTMPWPRRDLQRSKEAALF